MSTPGLLRTAGLAAVLIAMTPAPSGCVEFDGQTVVLHVDGDADRLDMLIVYRDLHTTEPDPAQAVSQLETLRDGARWFAFLSNFPFMFHIEEMLDDASPEQPAYARVLAALDERVEVRPGPPWLDGSGRLCGSQLVRVRGLADLVVRTNAAIREAYSDPDDAVDFYKDLDEESRTRLAAAVGSGHDFLSLRGAAVAYTLPISDRGFAEMKRSLLRVALQDASEAWARPPEESVARRELDAAIEFLAVNEWAVERTDGFVTFVLGNPRETRWTMEVPPVGRKRHETLLPALRAAGWEILGAEQEQAVREAFEAFATER